MDTVSYLTINDETKEIADIASRNDIQNMAAIIAAHTDDIEYIQLETSPQGSILSSIDDLEAMAVAAQVSSTAAIEAAAVADERAISATNAANTAWEQADSATQAAQSAWNKAGEATTAADLANQKATSATQAAGVAWEQADSATEAANEAISQAGQATSAANVARTRADQARESASAASSSASQANSYANGALAGLSTLESVIDTVEWFAQHRTPTTDTQVNIQKNYYTYDQNTGAMSKVDPSGLENPAAEGWYELDETIQNYVAAHVAESNDGLSILSLENNWKILISPGTGNYTEGIFIISPQGIVKQALTGNSGITFDPTTPFKIGNDNTYIAFYQDTDDSNKWKIKINGDAVSISSGVTIGEGNKTFSSLLNDLGQSINAIEYGVGNSPTTHIDIQNWSTTTPEWTVNKYVWMRTRSTDGLTYTYTCIQGAQGPKGETGDVGETGMAGIDGIGIESIEIKYADSNSEFELPRDEDWRDSVYRINPAYLEMIENATGLSGEDEEETLEDDDETDDITVEQYLPLEQGSWLWTRTITFYSDGSSSTSYQKTYIGTDGADGKSVLIKSVDKTNGVTTVVLEDSDGNTETLTIRDGEDGEDGTPGQPGIDGKPSYTHFAWADNIVLNNSTTPPTVNATGFDKSNSTNKLYIGVYADEYQTDSNNPNDYSWTLIKGEKGDTGSAAYSYDLLVEPSAIVKPSPAATPTSIAFTSKRTQGTAAPVLYAGRFKIETSVDGTNWTTAYTSAANESSKVYSPAANIKFVRGQLYLASNDDNLTTLVDTQTVPIISDGAKMLDIHPGVYLISELPDPSTNNVAEGDAYIVDDGVGSNDLYYKGTGATSWTIIEDWQGSQGPQGEPGIPGADAYTIVLTNENHGFPATSTAAINGSSTTCNIIAYKGGTQIPVTIGTITGTVTGQITASILNNNTTSAAFTVTVTNSLTTRSGELTIPIQADGKNFTKKFSWSLVPQGADGVSVTNITSTNNTGSGATNTITVTLSDNTTKTFNVKNGTNGTTPNITTQQITNGYQILVDNTVVATVNNGTNGQDGHSPSVTTRSTSGGYEILVDGSIVATVTNGANGLNSATVFLYKRAASASKPSSGSSTYTFSTGQLANVPSGWSQAFPAETQGNTTPVWMMCATASSTSATDSISYSEWSTPIKMVSSGSNGQNGSNGVDGYNTATVYLYQRSASQPNKPSNTLTYTFSSHNITSGTINNGWQTNIPSSGTNPIWVTAATVVGKDATQTIASTSWSEAVKLAENGESVTVSSTITKYISSSSGTSTPADSASWLDSPPSVSPGNYLWTRVRTTFSDSTVSTSYTVSRQGVNGNAGSSVTIVGTTYEYKLSSSGTEPPTGTWETTPQAPTTSQYAWTKTTTNFNDGSSTTTYTVGGKSGSNGTSYYTYIKYSANSNGANMTNSPKNDSVYIGIANTTSSTAPTSSDSYVWSRYRGDTGPEAVVTITPSNIDWDAGTATLTAVLRVNGEITTPNSYIWTKGTDTNSIGTTSTLVLNGSTNALDSTYNCTVTW